MIRLSEAIARANCRDEITPPMVKEAYSLLRQSIIHVEKGDIDMEDDMAEEDEPTDGNTMGDANANANAVTAASSSSQLGGSSPTRALTNTPAMGPGEALQKRKIVTITYDKFVSMMNLIVHHLSGIERSTGQGLSRADLVQWWLEQCESQMSSVAELDDERNLVEKVLTKLVKERQLLELRGEGLQQAEMVVASAETSAAGVARGAQATQSILFVHPDAPTG